MGTWEWGVLAFMASAWAISEAVMGGVRRRDTAQWDALLRELYEPGIHARIHALMAGKRGGDGDQDPRARCRSLAPEPFGSWDA